MERRNFNKSLGLLALGTIAGCKTNKIDTEGEVIEETLTTGKPEMRTRYQLSLAQWSLHNALDAKKLDNLDFAAKAAALGFTGVEYVSRYLTPGLKDKSYWKQMNEKAEAAGVKQLLIMTDLEGALGAKSPEERQEAIDEHIPWLDAAKELGCHSIRVNLWGEGKKTHQLRRCTKSLAKLCEIAKTYNLNVIVENHGGYSSDGQWLSQIMKDVNMDNCGTLPDFGNFCIAREGGERWGAPCIEEYDKYVGISEMMPYAKAVSAKSYAFDRKGSEININYNRMMGIVHNSGYEGFIGVEYEGTGLTEEEGITATKLLLDRCIKNLPK